MKLKELVGRLYTETVQTPDCEWKKISGIKRMEDISTKAMKSLGVYFNKKSDTQNPESYLLTSEQAYDEFKKLQIKIKKKKYLVEYIELFEALKELTSLSTLGRSGEAPRVFIPDSYWRSLSQNKKSVLESMFWLGATLRVSYELFDQSIFWATKFAANERRKAIPTDSLIFTKMKRRIAAVEGLKVAEKLEGFRKIKRLEKSKLLIKLRLIEVLKNEVAMFEQENSSI
jgi:hypothetical protein